MTDGDTFEVNPSHIAVIGMAGRFPEAEDLDGFWQNLAQGTESVKPVRVSGDVSHRPAFAELGDPDCFDSDYFGYAPRESLIIDPQHRLFMECAVEALECAGEDPARFPGPIGVYAGGSQTGHLESLRAVRDRLGNPSEMMLGFGTGIAFLTTRVAYQLGLRGPAVTVQTACSTSLVAVHQAAQALLAGDCDMALAGGASVHIPTPVAEYTEDGAMSGDGHCRAFDAAASGSVGGDAVGIVVLKRLEDAVADGNTIHAVLIGTAVNNDGHDKIGFTAPSVSGQAEVMRTALKIAEIGPDTVSYVETHGTGTRLGDPIEVAALTAAYGPGLVADRPRGPIWIGSLKTNIGHSDAAAGVAGLIKTILALRHRLIPPSLNFETPNPEIDFENSPFRVNAALREWESHGAPRRAAVNAIGVGGTNAHVLLEEAPPVPRTTAEKPSQLVVISAKSRPALSDARSRLAEHLKKHPATDLADVAWTTQMGRQGHPYRQAFVASTGHDLVARLADTDSAPVEPVRGTDRSVAMVFPGHGGQKLGMARELYLHEEAFRASFDSCAAAFAPHLDVSLPDVLFGEASSSAGTDFAELPVAHAAIFSVEMALYRLWESWGITPDVVAGQSLGSYAAACVAGVFTLADAAAVVTCRSRLLETLPSGGMLAVSLPESEVSGLLTDGVSLGAVNGPDQCVVSGPMTAVVELAARLEKDGVDVRRLHIPGAGHSSLVDSITGRFADYLASVEFGRPVVPFVSDSDGRLMDPDRLTTPQYWVNHMRSTVRFGDVVSTLLDADNKTILEVGPGRSMTTLVRRHPDLRKDHLVVSSLPHPSAPVSDLEHILGSAGSLWGAGHDLDWHGVHSGAARRRIALPTYPFQRTRFRLDPTAEEPVQIERVAVADVDPEVLLEEPGTTTEAAVARVFEEVLGISQPARQHDFFKLGGDSLLATQLTSRLRKDLSIRVSVREVFHAPTVAALAELVETKLASASADRNDAATSDGAALVPVPRAEDGMPLSFAQQRLWFLEQLGLDGLDLSIPGMLRVRGRLDVEALGAAFSGLVARHEVLRTRFVIGAGGEPVQVVDEPGPVRIRLIDLSGVQDSEAREVQVRETVDAEALKPFDLAKDALLRVCLVRVSDEDHVLVLAMHHIVSDGWSIGVLTRELSELYAAAVHHRDAKLPELPLQYADFAIWQRQWLQGDVLERQLGYWRDQLAALEPLELPTDHPRPAERTGKGATVEFDLPSDLTAGLRAVAADTGTSLYMVLLTAFNILLGTYARRDDIAIGTPIAGRNRAEIEGLIGFFVNTLVIRADLRANPTFKDLLAQIKDTTLAAYDHQDLPFERLVEELAPERDLSRTPLFQVMFILQNASDETWQFTDLDIDTYPNASRVAQFDLTLSIQETSEGLKGLLLYSTDLFDAPTMKRLAGHFENLLTSVVADPTASLNDLDMLSDTEKHQLIVEWNDTAADFPRDRCIHELVEAQAAQRPDAPAVIFGNQELTYAQLNAKANQLAHHLRTLGVGPDTLVAICLERSPDMIVSLLAVLKAGGAYVPLDPQYPAERLTFMLTDTAAPVLLTQSNLHNQLPHNNTKTVCIDTDTDTIANFPDTNPDHHTTPDHLAYVIYTSGSTGTPKGVMIQHRSLGARVWDMRRHYGLGQGDAFLQFASMTFDVGTENVFTTLLAGGQLVLRAVEWTPEELAEIITRRGISAANLPPAVWEQMLPHLDPAKAASLRRLVLGGEALSAALVSEWFQRFSVPLVNAYGPTETTVTATTAVITSADAGVPIGRPVANTELFVVDQADRLVPVGVPGELLVGGVGVGRGYLNRPELTAEKFVEMEIGGTTRRVYRTGDLVRWLPSGDLEFLGRIDTQVKMRGIRIELGEIEARLVAHQDVASAVVDVREDSPGDKRLTAYVVPRPGARPGASALRRWCADGLPDFIVPGAFMVLSELPLTPNGKVDRRALPAPDADRPELAAAYVAPRDETEAAIAGIWAQVLGVDRVGVHDNFFDLGGHSLLATRVVVDARARGFRLLPKDILKTPTVAGLGAVLRSPGKSVRALSVPDPSAPEIVRLNLHVPGRPTLFCVHEIGGGTSAYAHLAHQLDGQVNVLGIDVPADGTAVERDITEQAARYLAAVCELDPEGPYCLAGWSFGGLVAMEMARQARASNLEVGMLAVIDSVLPSEQVRKRTTEDAEAIDALLADIDSLRSVDEPNGIRPDAMDVMRAAGVSDDILLLGHDAVESHLRIRKFQIQAMASFVPRPVDCNLRLYTALDNQWMNSLEAVWSPFVDSIEVSDLAGDHYSIMRLPSIGLIADDIVRHMAEIRN
ncbi:non-ribosomal peptide synthetase/type I polyketide synthase [Streptomyces sp. NBC_01237]|uniref:non-ribosomal peptide synthetase/type I polyketide synthase n=1 Tax=Streptomyces sp. NBC_01237 TaxID=2903790 RepID=UPI002DDC55E5|nr:non-ribosomal peptide synthetase/type I polyketide synthase [Streptomyces sp. NBC_01237]WRZ76369.1 amino acid adenylation domain-containing protein [Streptomyces sp. NBC_01237]